MDILGISLMMNKVSTNCGLTNIFINVLSSNKCINVLSTGLYFALEIYLKEYVWTYHTYFLKALLENSLRDSHYHKIF